MNINTSESDVVKIEEKIPQVSKVKKSEERKTSVLNINTESDVVEIEQNISQKSEERKRNEKIMNTTEGYEVVHVYENIPQTEDDDDENKVKTQHDMRIHLLHVFKKEHREQKSDDEKNRNSDDGSSVWNPFVTDKPFGQYFIYNTKEYLMLKKMKQKWKQHVIKEDAFYGFEQYVSSFIPNVMLSLFWTDFLIRQSSHISKVITMLSKEVGYCEICAMKDFLDSLNLKYGKKGKYINPVSFSICEALVTVLHQKLDELSKLSNTDIFNHVFQHIFMATDFHARGVCTCGKRRDPKQVTFIKNPEKGVEQKDMEKLLEQGIASKPMIVVFPFQKNRTFPLPNAMKAEKLGVSYKRDLDMYWIIEARDVCIFRFSDELQDDERSHRSIYDVNQPSSLHRFSSESVDIYHHDNKLERKFKLEDNLLDDLFRLWLPQLESWRSTVRQYQVESAMIVALYKLKTLLDVTCKRQSNSVPQLTLVKKGEEEEEEELQIPQEWIEEVHKFHSQIFSAAGDLKTYSVMRVMIDSEKLHIATPDANLISSECFLHQCTDLLFRETLCLVSEHIQHCPHRINYLFHRFRNDIKNITSEELNKLFTMKTETLPLQEPPDLDYIALFERRMKHNPRIIVDQTDHFWPSVNKILIQNLDEIKKGLKEFKDDKLNFDDINDCGKWDKKELTKTFREPFSLCLLAFIVIKYVPEIVILKLWTICALYLFYNPDISLIPIFTMVDIAFMFFFFIFSWCIRIFSTCFCFPFSMNCVSYACNNGSKGWSLILRMGLEGLLFVGTVGGLYYEIKDNISIDNLWIAMKNMMTIYLPVRFFVIACQVFLPMSAVTNTKTFSKGKNCSFFNEEAALKGTTKRMIFRILFMILFIATTGLYEYYSIVMKFDTLTSPYCGLRDHTFTSDFDTQGAVCNMSWLVLWVVTIAGFVIDNGLAFTLLMSLFGLILGIRRQGEPRALIRISKQELSQKIFDRFSQTRVIKGQLDQKEKKKKRKKGYTVVKTDQEIKEELFKKVWNFCISYWRKKDLISDREKKMLEEPVVDVSLLSSAQARETIGFWINSLTIEPISRFTFDLIPKTTIIIPVYEEKLEFSWKDDTRAPYSCIDEARYLVAKYPHHWFHLVERVKDLNSPEKSKYITNWLSMHDQLVYRTVHGAASYYKALVLLAQMDLDIKRKDAKNRAREKIEIILCFQTYQKLYNDVSPIILKWLKKWPFLKVVYDYTRQKQMPLEMCQNIPLCCDFATVFICWEPEGMDKDDKKGKDAKGKLIHRVIPRENPLLLVNTAGDRLQGKSMNQLNGVMFQTGQYIQVLDANQGGHATEYLKFPALLDNFKPGPDGNPRRRIIGCREYIFTGSLSRVASYHAYQEWSFGTLVLRVYSDLGIRLHYGHPDVFHAPWVRAHSGLSKVNPKINTSEDVFAGFETMQCKERTKHLEHIQVEKGRETGLANMSSFDSKISAGNAGLLRSRDLYHLTERLPLLKRFLFFYGISGHFLTNTMMVISMYWYIWGLFFFSLAGVSIQAIGGSIFATEWLLHAGFTTVIPLFAELLVEKGPTLGTLEAVLFIPVSTIAYLFQMQTKHAALCDSMVTGNAAHISTGRGLQIYRRSLVTLFNYYSYTHLYPIFEIFAITFGYWSIASELHGGSLPLIMVYVFSFCVLSAPQLFNPTLKGSSLSDIVRDLFQFVSWVGKPTSRMTISDWEKNLKEVGDQQADFVRYCAVKDMAPLPTTRVSAFLFVIAHLLFSFGFWVLVSIFLLYPPIQFWLSFFLECWFVYMAVFILFCFFKGLRSFQTPASMLLILTWTCLFFVLLAFYSASRVPPWSSIYVAFFVFVKILQSFRSCALNGIVLAAYQIYQTSIDEKEKDKQRRKGYIIYYIILANQIFMVSLLRSIFAIAWGFYSFLIAILMRPQWANLFLFGRYNGLENHIEVERLNQQSRTLDFDHVEDTYFKNLKK